MFKRSLILSFFTLFVCSTVFAEPSNNNTSALLFDSQKIKTKLAQSLGVTVTNLKPSAMSGLAEAVTDQGLFYVSYDGNYLLHGKLFGLAGGDVVNLTEASLEQVRIAGMKEFEQDMIVFPAKNEKHVVTVFTDITCGYCRKLHDQMADYNDKGITVRYLAYPRSGITDRTGQLSQGFKDLRSIWCSKDPQVAMTTAKSGGSIAPLACNKTIEKQFEFGRQIGVNATPAIIFSNGMMIPGYQDPDKLEHFLNNI